MAKRNEDLELILQDCLQKIRSGESLDSVLASYPEQADEFRPLLEAALWIHSRKANMDPRLGFVGASSRRLVEGIKQEQLLKTSPDKAGGFGSLWQRIFAPKRHALQFAAALMLVLTLFVSGAGIARASQNTLPGDTLYPVKLQIEQVQVSLTPNEAAKTAMQVRLAELRLAEIQALLLENRNEQVAYAVEQFEGQVNLAIRAIIQLNDRDHEKAQQLAGSLTGTLRDQAQVLGVLASSAPTIVQREVEQLLLVAGGVVDLVENTIPAATEPALAGGTITPTPSATVGIVQILGTSTATTRPTITPSPVSTGTPTSSVINATKTVTPTVTIGSIEDEDPTQTPTEKPKPTKKPRPTKRPKGPPDPRNRPDLPTDD